MASYDAEVFAAALRDYAADGRVTAQQVAAAFWRAAPHMQDLLVAGSTSRDEAEQFVLLLVVPQLRPAVEALGLVLADGRPALRLVE